MARRGWVRSIPLATLVAAAAGAAQLGIGYGLGIVAWTPPGGDGPTATGAWTASLAWASWIAATSVVVGAVIAERGTRSVGNGRLARLAVRLTIVFAAALGALIVIPLVGVPASRANIADNYAPHLLAGIYAGIGVVVGLLMATAAVYARAVGANVIASAGWLWALAIAALASGVGWPGYGQLGVWKFTDGPIWQSYYLPGALLALAAALLIGGLAAFPAASRGAGAFGVMVSGSAGPLILMAAYILADPVSGQVPDEQLSAYATAPIAVVVGVVGSFLAAIVGRPPARRRRRSNPPSEAAPEAVDEPATEPAGYYSARPLPPPSATAVTGKASVPASSRVDPVSLR